MEESTNRSINVSILDKLRENKRKNNLYITDQEGYFLSWRSSQFVKIDPEKEYTVYYIPKNEQKECYEVLLALYNRNKNNDDNSMKFYM